MPLQTLAQSATTKATQGDVVLWVAILIVVAFVGGIAILLVRKRLLAKDHPAAAGSLMDEIRGMLERGEITQAEFDATRRAMVKKLAAAHPGQPKKPPVSIAPRGVDSHPASKRPPDGPTRSGPSA